MPTTYLGMLLGATSKSKNIWNALANNLDTNEDSLQWLRANNGKFTIKSAYRHFDRPAEMFLPWPWKIIWKINV
ncbi:hypothetical protein H5410_020169 [Solanum commersonii]|uniref:Uncharacterized protein n=1 Tax=Solanum commersonii TaxID=4109 RepID=A0A9J5ZAF3_SOLCO|nr:hypothetical protein H5410_020169 [Solanum commersonii]